jgi:hypothetical protein
MLCLCFTRQGAGVLGWSAKLGLYPRHLGSPHLLEAQQALVTVFSALAHYCNRCLTRVPSALALCARCTKERKSDGPRLCHIRCASTVQMKRI